MSRRPLHEISAELLRLGDELTARGAPNPAEAVGVSRLSDHDRAVLAHDLYRERRLRDDLLGTALFGEPAWDLLLDLYSRQQCGTPTSISSACIAATGPQTTALRHLSQMLAEGVLIREPDSTDARRSWVRLSDSMLALMDGYLERVAGMRSVECENQRRPSDS